MPKLVCPYCARPPADGDGPSRDHVFVHAMGGHATVTACKDCNDQLGSYVEGELLRPSTLLNLIRQTRGGGNPLRGVLPDGREAKYDLTTHELQFVKPVDAQLGHDTMRFIGSPDQARGLLRKQGLTPAQIDCEIAKAHNVEFPEDTWISTTVQHSPDLADRLAAKVAPGAGALAGDHAFIVSDLANLLRDVLWARSSVSLRFDTNFLAFYDNMIGQIPRPPTARPVATLVPPQDASQAAFLPMPGDERRTIVIVHIAGHDLGTGAIGYEAATPFGQRLPLLIRDSETGASVHSVLEELGAAVGGGLIPDTSGK